MRTSWCDEEHAALLGLPWMARVLYLQGLRMHMDYGTGLVGATRGISYQSLREVLFVEPCTGRQDAGSPSVKAVRVAIEQLVRAGLIAGVGTDKRLIFQCLLAERDDSDQKKEGRPRADLGQTFRGTEIPSADNDITTIQGRPRADLGQTYQGTPPVSGIPEEKRVAIAPLSLVSDLWVGCRHDEVIGLYHEVLPELPRVVVSRWQGSAAAKALAARWREDDRHRSMEFWRRFFGAVRLNPHWMGHNDRQWTADLRWLVKRENFDKVIAVMVNKRAA